MFSAIGKQEASNVAAALNGKADGSRSERANAGAPFS